MSYTKEILCSKCHVTPERGFERNGEPWAACSVCGQEDPIETILREAAEHRAHQAIGNMLRGAFSSGNITVDETPQREFRWLTAE